MAPSGVVEEAVAQQPVEELQVYDFDGTLVNTPTPETGMKMYEEATGERWPHVGWWGRKESLEPPMVHTAGPAMEEFHALMSVSQASRVMMTGRRSHLAPYVEDILREFNVVCDEYIFNGTRQDTLTYKLYELRRLVATHPELKRVKIWEDRVKHAKAFKEFGDNSEYRHLQWEVVLVEPSNNF